MNLFSSASGMPGATSPPPSTSYVCGCQYFFSVFRQGAIGGVADDVFDAEQLGVGSGAVEEHTLEHVIVTGAGVAGAVMLGGEQELRVVLGGMDAAEVNVVSGQRRLARAGIFVAGGLRPCARPRP